MNVPAAIRGSAAGLILIGLLTAPATAQPGGADAIAAVRITQCVVMSPLPLSRKASGTAITFVNTGPTLLHHITFEVGYKTVDGTLVRSVNDAGIFAPNTSIRRRFDLYRDVLFAGHTVTRCVVTVAR